MRSICVALLLGVMSLPDAQASFIQSSNQQKLYAFSQIDAQRKKDKRTN